MKWEIPPVWLAILALLLVAVLGTAVQARGSASLGGTAPFAAAEPQALAGLFQPGQAYDPAVAHAAIASAERSLAAQGEGEPDGPDWRSVNPSANL